MESGKVYTAAMIGFKSSVSLSLSPVKFHLVWRAQKTKLAFEVMAIGDIYQDRKLFAFEELLLKSVVDG